MFNNPSFIQFSHFHPSIAKHCFTTRHGGASHGYFASMNMCYNRGDADNNVQQNYNIVCNFLGVNSARLAFTKQVHGSEIRVVSHTDFIDGYTVHPCDAIMTNFPNITLVSFYADCVPLFFLDPIKKAAALAHAGWRGTLLDIGAKTAARMVEEYNCNPANILVGIGPSIGKCCFEVGEDVALEFRDKHSEVITDLGNGKFLIDLWSVNRKIIGMIIPPQNIEISGICTKCNHNDFFSHRYMGEERGSMASFICLT